MLMWSLRPLKYVLVASYPGLPRTRKKYTTPTFCSVFFLRLRAGRPGCEANVLAILITPLVSNIYRMTIRTTHAHAAEDLILIPHHKP